MATMVLKQKGYGIVEFNNFSAQRLGSKAQLALSIEDFSDVLHPCEQGMMLVYDEGKDCVRKAKDLSENVMFHKSEEKLYDDKQTLKDFALFGQEGIVVNVKGMILRENGVLTGSASDTTDVTLLKDRTPYPRLYTFINNDTWTSNTVLYDDGEFSDFLAIANEIETGNVWAAVAVGETNDALNGYPKLTKTKPNAKVVLRAVKAYDLPDGQPGIRFEVYSTM